MYVLGPSFSQTSCWSLWKDVFLSSIKAYEAAQFNYNNVKGQRWADAMNWGVGNRPIDQWAFFEGVFTIPVCSDSAGYALTSPGATKSFPCSCGSNNGDQTGPFRVSLPVCKFRPSKSNMRQLSGRISTWRESGLSELLWAIQRCW